MKPHLQHAPILILPAPTPTNNLHDWYAERWRDEKTNGYSYNSFICSRATPQMMDGCWADGWRHFGAYFFRMQMDVLNDIPMQIRSLRIRAQDFLPSASQRRIVRKNRDLRVEFQPIHLTEAHEILFEKHKRRFTQNTPESLYDFLSEQPASMPCRAYECRVLSSENRLLAVSFFDIGEEAASSIYAMFDTDESARGLGIFTLLAELDFVRQSGKKYLYTGYIHEEASFYDYKKHFAATEYYDWCGAWLPFGIMQA
jgi:leucyl-tRNA---protein transferase